MTPAAVPFDQWDRRQGIGASDLPGIAGVSPWSTGASVWLDKMDLSTTRETDLMRAGRDLETVVLRMAGQRLDRRLVGNRMTFPHPQFPGVPLYATPDGFTVPRQGALLECKVVSHRLDDWKGGPPLYVQWQVQAQLACLPRVRGAIVAALVGGDVRTWTIDRDPQVQDDLPDLVAGWWRDHVLADRAPAPTSQDDAWALLRAHARVAPGRQERVATPAEQRAGTELRGLLAARLDLDADIEDRRLTLAEAARDSDVLGLGWRATWGARSTVDWRALAADLAVPLDTIEAHTRQSPAFTFRQSREDTP